MKLGQELCNLSSEREKKVEEVWNLMQEVLRRFAKKTGERGCNVIFDASISRRRYGRGGNN